MYRLTDAEKCALGDISERLVGIDDKEVTEISDEVTKEQERSQSMSELETSRQSKFELSWNEYRNKMAAVASSSDETPLCNASQS